MGCTHSTDASTTDLKSLDAGMAASTGFGPSVLCTGCGKQFNYNNKISLAIGDKTWHNDCFQCARCGSRLERGSKCTMSEGLPYHEHCFLQLVADEKQQQDSNLKKRICHGCNKVIHGEFTVAMGHDWHKNHFACSKCGTSLATQKAFEIQGQVYCEKDYQAQFGSKCDACKKPIKGEHIIAFNKKFHPEHFNCVKCKISLNDGGDYKEYLDQPYCEGCVPKFIVCTRCNKELKYKPGETFLIDTQGQPYCKAHDDQYHKKKMW